ncbi:MAG: DNA adenine methylase [Deltaproteobacteria bacterium]|nr:MAG: DNA adenine methylase [Deltaproteobacteria bacterium]
MARRAKRPVQDDHGPLRPFLKWAGGKRRLVAQIVPHLPRQFGRFHEPFVGSGALYFHLRPTRASLSDTNERLVRTYSGLRDEPDRVIELLSSYPHDKQFFLKMRAQDIDERSDAEVAAWFIYLNKTAYNGLYRVNSKNGYNVPFGDYRRPNICDEPTLRHCAKQLKRVKLQLSDFESAARRARKGDLVYFDPPYVPLSATSYFTSYTTQGFGLEDHRRLRDLALALKRRGVHVRLSNSGSPVVRDLYRDDFKLIPIKARRDINCRAASRGEIIELFIK